MGERCRRRIYPASTRTGFRTCLSDAAHMEWTDKNSVTLHPAQDREHGLRCRIGAEGLTGINVVNIEAIWGMRFTSVAMLLHSSTCWRTQPQFGCPQIAVQAEKTRNHSQYRRRSVPPCGGKSAPSGRPLAMPLCWQEQHWIAAQQWELSGLVLKLLLCC